MSKKISLNPKYYTNVSNYPWTTTTYNSLEYYISTNKSHSTVSTMKCEFTTPFDNIDIVVEIGSSSENNYDWCYVGQLDNSIPTYDSNLDRISGSLASSGRPDFKTLTINVAKAGTHFLIIGYRKDNTGSLYHDCGYFRLVTTEVDSKKADPYIYCGTKTTVTEEPIDFVKTNTNSTRGFKNYTGSDNRFQWESIGGYSTYYRSKVSFTTTSDNTVITLIYEYYFNYKVSEFAVSNVDNSTLYFNSNDYVYLNSLGKSTVQKKITIQKAGDHSIMIGYYIPYSSDYVYVGLSGTNVITNTRTLTPESILANNKDIDKVYVGSELIWEKSRIMWFQNVYKEMTFTNNSNSITTNGKMTIPANTYTKFSYGNNIISGSNKYYSQAYYGVDVKNIISGGYIYLSEYQRAMDLSVFPNPVNMKYRHGWSNRVGNCMFLKINPNLKKETTSLSNMFLGFNKENYNN